MLARIQESFDRVRQFTADASHELRAPMTLIYTAAQSSLRRERSGEELTESMRKILRESQRTTALINDLLQLARGDAGRDTPSLVPLDATPILREVAEEASTMAAPKQLEVQCSLATAMLPVSADEASLRRLLLILVDNAVKFTPHGGRIVLTGDRDTSHVILSVSDTGPGIAPDDQPRIFERFWRADQVRARDAGGSGLGLPIARRIAEHHGASLTVESEPGTGSTFTVRLRARGAEGATGHG